MGAVPRYASCKGLKKLAFGLSALEEEGSCALSLKQKQLYPSVVPRPVLGAYHLQVPILGIDGEAKVNGKFVAEEACLREDASLRQRTWASSVGAMSLMNDDEDEDEESAVLREEAELDKKLLRMLQVCVKKTGKDGKSKGFMRALGIVRRLRMAKSVQIAAMIVRSCKSCWIGTSSGTR